MKKWIIFLVLVLILAACNSGNNDEASEQEKMDVTKTEESAKQLNVAEESVSDSNVQSDDGNEEQSSDKTKEETKQPTETNGNTNDKAVEDEHEEVVDLAYDIFDAQHKKDYGFLESVAAKGTKVDRDNNKFIFENVTYPFEMDFLTKEDLGNLEFRYTHEEDGIVYVGFGAIHSGDKSSFVIDFQFVQENGKWKMQSMDINK